MLSVCTAESKTRAGKYEHKTLFCTNTNKKVLLPATNGDTNVPLRATKSHWELQLQSFLKLTVDGGGWSTSGFPRQKSPPGPFDQEAFCGQACQVTNKNPLGSRSVRVLNELLRIFIVVPCCMLFHCCTVLHVVSLLYLAACCFIVVPCCVLFHCCTVMHVVSLLYRAACCFNLFFIAPTHALHYTLKY